MKRSTFVIFGLFAVFFAILIPVWVIDREGGSDDAPEGKELFATNCGSCHTLAGAGTDGVVGPDLDDTLARPGPTDPDPATIEPRVLNAIENGVDGRMPADILSGDQADIVAAYVAETAGR